MKPGNWKELTGGHRYRFGVDNHLSTTIGEIAKALSQINRYTGHTLQPYSVAQHCVVVSRYLDFEPNWAMHGLLHDAPEIIIGDLSSPLKWHLGQEWLVPIREEEQRAMVSLTRAIGLPAFAEMDEFTKRIVKRADLTAMMTEKRDLLDRRCVWSDYADWPAAHWMTIVPETAMVAAKNFVKRFRELKRRLK